MAPILILGGGRANITKTLSKADFVGRLSRQGRFALPALEAFGAAELREMLSGLGVATS